MRAGKVFIETQLLTVNDIDDDIAFRQLKGGLHGIEEAGADAILDDDPVHHDVDIMLVILS